MDVAERRDWRRTLGAGALPTTAISLGLAAPKLLPILEVLAKHPRLVDSTETIDFGGFVEVLTSRDQDMSSGHGGVSQWGWHEWGMYVGWAVVAAVVLGAIAGRGTRESAPPTISMTLALSRSRCAIGR